MNGSPELLQQFHVSVGKYEVGKVATVLCPPSILVGQGAALFAGTHLHMGGQNCHAAEAGAYTGEVSAAMLARAGAAYVILGHSERRDGFGETCEQIREKVKAAHKAGLKAILCVGEHLADRAARRHIGVVRSQVEQSLPTGAHAGNTVIAYEPVWAIGSGQSARLDQIAEMHVAIAGGCAPEQHGISLLYGGSVKPETAGKIARIAHVDGFLVGGASLSVASFFAIAEAAGQNL